MLEPVSDKIAGVQAYNFIKMILQPGYFMRKLKNFQEHLFQKTFEK